MCTSSVHIAAAYMEAAVEATENEAKKHALEACMKKVAVWQKTHRIVPILKVSKCYSSEWKNVELSIPMPYIAEEKETNPSSVSEMTALLHVTLAMMD